MNAYSSDLRQRVAAACAEVGRTQGQVAAQFQVSTSFVAKQLRGQRLTSTTTAKLASSGAWP